MTISTHHNTLVEDMLYRFYIQSDGSLSSFINIFTDPNNPQLTPEFLININNAYDARDLNVTYAKGQIYVPLIYNERKYRSFMYDVNSSCSTNSTESRVPSLIPLFSYKQRATRSFTPDNDALIIKSAQWYFKEYKNVPLNNYFNVPRNTHILLFYAADYHGGIYPLPSEHNNPFYKWWYQCCNENKHLSSFKLHGMLIGT